MSSNDQHPDSDNTEQSADPAVPSIGAQMADAFTTLLSELATGRQGFDTDERLDAITYSVVAVIRFLEQDERVIHSGLAEPLYALSNALWDLSHGGRPALIFNRKVARGRPTNQAAHSARGAIAVCVERLFRAGMSRAEAGAFVAREMRKQRFRDDKGRLISATKVLLWRDEINGRAPELQTEMYKKINDSWPVQPNLMLLQLSVRQMIANVARTGFV